MSIEIIADKDDLFRLRVVLVNKFLHELRPVSFRPPLRNAEDLSDEGALGITSESQFLR